MASVAEIAPLSTEFNMPGQQTQAKDAVTKEIEKLGFRFAFEGMNLAL